MFSEITASSPTPARVPSALPPVIQAKAATLMELRPLKAIVVVMGRASSRRATGTASGRKIARVGTAVRENPKPMEPCIKAPSPTAKSATANSNADTALGRQRGEVR